MRRWHKIAIGLALFAAISLVALFSGKDFSFLRSILIVGGMLAMGLIILGIAFGFNLGLWFSVIMVFFAGAAILYQTSRIFNHYDESQYVVASLGLFSAFMLLLWYVLRILLSFVGD